jgi:hypothetical protein
MTLTRLEAATIYYRFLETLCVFRHRIAYNSTDAKHLIVVMAAGGPPQWIAQIWTLWRLYALPNNAVPRRLTYKVGRTPSGRSQLRNASLLRISWELGGFCDDDI